MAAIRMHIDKFNGMVLIDEHHPLVAAQRGRTLTLVHVNSSDANNEQNDSRAHEAGAPERAPSADADVNAGPGNATVTDTERAHEAGAAAATSALTDEQVTPPVAELHGRRRGNRGSR